LNLRDLRHLRPSLAEYALSSQSGGRSAQIRPFSAFSARHSPCTRTGQVNRDRGRKVPVNRIRTATAAALLVSFVGVQPAPAMAAQDRDRRDRYEDRRDRIEQRRERRDDRRDRRFDRRFDRYEVRRDYWDASRDYRRDDRRYRARRLGRNDRIYRGSDNRYYCRRDDGTTGLIVGGITGGVLGQIIAPGGSKTLGAIIGAGAGALIGRAIDRGDVVCR
jgi:hypothetical protein